MGLWIIKHIEQIGICTFWLAQTADPPRPSPFPIQYRDRVSGVINGTIN